MSLYADHFSSKGHHSGIEGREGAVGFVDVAPIVAHPVSREAVDGFPLLSGCFHGGGASFSHDPLTFSADPDRKQQDG